MIDIKSLVPVVKEHAGRCALRYSLPRAQIELDDLLSRTVIALQAAAETDPARYENLTADDWNGVISAFTLNTVRNLARELARGNKRNGHLIGDGEIESVTDQVATPRLEVEEELTACRLWLARTGSNRDLLLFDLLREDTPRDEIAQRLETTTAHVHVMVHRLTTRLRNYRNRQ